MNTRYFTSRLLALMLAALLVFSCAAAEETEIPSGVVDNFVQSEIEKQQSASDATAFEAGAAAGEYYADFTFGGVQTLSGITTTLSLYANLPKYAKPVSAVLRLSYTASDLILTDISSLTYYMNGTPFGSSKIVARSDGAQTVLYVSVPVELLTTGYNLLEILSYVRLTDDEGCRDDYNGANWVKIADTTCLRIYYEISDDADELYMYPYPFISLMNPDGAESVVAVSDAADEAELTAARQELQSAIVSLPNFPAEIVPEGKTAEDNLVVKLVESYTALPENPLPHWELARKYDIIDFDLGVKLTGAGFPVYKGKGARLQRALINYFLDCNTAAGYLEVEPPVMVNEASGFGTGQLPDKEGQMYHATVDNFYLVPTAEVPVTNIYRDVILEKEDFPVKMTAYTPCFRREAGSYGKDVRGLNRLHQFDKVEIVQLSLPEKSYEALDGMVAHVESIVKALGLPYRILRLCGGDMSFTSALTYDFEVYSEAQKRWLEVSSVSNFESFQATRLQLRYRAAEKKLRLAHTLNGSSLALPRIVAALLENYQTPEGIRIPEALIPYTGFDIIK